MHHPAWDWDPGGGAEGTQKLAHGAGLPGRDLKDGYIHQMERVGCRVGERS